MLTTFNEVNMKPIMDLRKQYGEIIDCSPSRFLDELPQEDLVWEGQEDTPVEVKTARGNDALASMRAMLKR